MGYELHRLCDGTRLVASSLDLVVEVVLEALEGFARALGQLVVLLRGERRADAIAEAKATSKGSMQEIRDDYRGVSEKSAAFP